VHDPGGSGLDAAMIAINRRVLADFCVREAFGLLLRNEERGQQRPHPDTATVICKCDTGGGAEPD
jgi:hypothetical protein